MKRTLVKIVRDEHGMHLVSREYADIAKEPFGVLSKRPMVYLSDPHDAIEKAMWCYERGMIPLIAEAQPELSNGMATKYDIDSLITDAISLKKLLPHLEARTTRLACISILGGSFNMGKLSPFARFTERMRFVRVLPDNTVVVKE